MQRSSASAENSMLILYCLFLTLFTAMMRIVDMMLINEKENNEPLTDQSKDKAIDRELESI